MVTEEFNTNQYIISLYLRLDEKMDNDEPLSVTLPILKKLANKLKLSDAT
jgi:hypothetical protein